MYNVLPGDTFDRISRKVYGTEIYADNIKRANPGAREPLSPGSTLVIPSIPGAPQDIPHRAPTVDPDEVAVLINGQRFRYWDSVAITRSIDSVDTIELGAPFESTRAEFRNTFRPFSYARMETTLGGRPFFTGTMLTPMPTVQNNQKRVAVNGYALPGVLGDCTPPASSFPLEFDRQNLEQIARQLCRPYGIDVFFAAPVGAIFDRVACRPGQSIMDFLSGLAKDRNLVISSRSRGALLFRRSASTGNPVADFVQGQPALLSITPEFNPQQYFSSITAMEPAVIGLPGDQYTVNNPRLNNVVRPHSYQVPDTPDADLREAALTKTGRMFGGICSYNIEVPTWRDSNNNLWETNRTITVTAPDAMIYRKYEFLIRRVRLAADPNTRKATLNVVLPGAYSGEIPRSLPWDE